LQARPELIAGSFAQCEAGDGGAMNGGEIGVVGLVTGIARLAQTAGRKRVDDARLEAGGREGAADDVMVAAGAFDGDDEVAEIVLLHGLAELLDGSVEGGTAVLDDRRGDQ